MDKLKKNLNAKLVTPLAVCVVAVFFFAVATGWQYMQILRKDLKINSLMSENKHLKKSLSSIDAELLEIKDTASDVRLFQKELAKVISDIDPNYSATFASRSEGKPSCAFDETVDFDHQAALQSANESILVLSNSQEKMRFDAAGLLGKAVSIREALEVTPSLIPISGGHISSEFGPRVDPITGVVKLHSGIDLAAPIGTPVYASADGIIKRATFDRELGNVIEIAHANAHVTTYGHLSEILVRHNARVKRGDRIGSVGNTGLRCAGAHLHFGVSKNGVRQNPRKFMLRSPQNVF